MLRRFFGFLPIAAVLAFFALAASNASAWAATQVTGDDSAWEIAKAVYEAFASKNYGLTGALLVLLLVAVAKRYAPGKLGKFFHTDAGGSLLVLLGSGATAAIAALAAPGAHVTLGLLKTSFFVGLTAAGGYAVLKNLLIEPVLKPLAAKAPAWLQPLFSAVFWAFDHVGDDGSTEVAKAEKAGADAVAASPGGGASAIAGEPEKF